ncbi:pyridoxal phosphate-dependent aminotransferase [Simiduia agarivorans]|uniref:GntR family transcriptional regulator n=1 Tax=Simiduia agarivorans (strain DSM 21679 / JCM 13881 / BCRC 17597 / SA1) TaxID=1117647 RepID=K4KEG6_SIMAS|nr:PLP-dependent aminotransferase family protein [Simiduia agarivorans]AFU97444.1 GntR family transcriptional regulator [Simiduia agarivorans SA1 = DSM 21679]
MKAPHLVAQPVSVTRKMAAALPKLAKLAAEKGLQLHHLGAGYPHPEVTDPTDYIARSKAWFDHLAQDTSLRDVMRPLYGYTDTLGPRIARERFAEVYGRDFNASIDPDSCIPTIGSTGGINLLCSLFERAGEKIGYITDAPTYAGFLARAGLCQQARIYSVDMDAEGPDPAQLRAQIHRARAEGRFVPFYYTVPDGHNPGGISFSNARRRAILEVLRDEDVLVVEDAPYNYISFDAPEDRPHIFYSLAPEQTVHLFTASKVGLPGPRIGFAFTQARITLKDGSNKALTDLLLTEASSQTLLHNPEALMAFAAFLGDDSFATRASLWPMAEQKIALYRENRDLLLSTLKQRLGDHPDLFQWTEPGAGFFSVFTLNHPSLHCDTAFTERLVADYGVVTIPTFSFYPDDARARNPMAGLNQLRLSFCFSEGEGAARRQQLLDASNAFASALRQECRIDQQ